MKFSQGLTPRISLYSSLITVQQLLVRLAYNLTSKLKKSEFFCLY